MNVIVKKLVVGPIEENCYLVYDEENESGECFLVDPGAGGSRIVNAMRALNRKPAAIFLTHGHFDHIMAVEWIRKEYPEVTVYAWEAEKEVLEDPDKSMLRNIGDYSVADVNYVEDGMKLTLAGIACEVIATPGHTAGSSCLCLFDAGILFSGDTLFYESCGRTDFPTGSTNALSHSINDVLMGLPDATKVYPGHGEETTIEHERMYNFMVLMR